MAGEPAKQIGLSPQNDGKQAGSRVVLSSPQLQGDLNYHQDEVLQFITSILNIVDKKLGPDQSCPHGAHNTCFKTTQQIFNEEASNNPIATDVTAATLSDHMEYNQYQRAHKCIPLHTSKYEYQQSTNSTFPSAMTTSNLLENLHKSQELCIHDPKEETNTPEVENQIKNITAWLMSHLQPSMPQNINQHSPELHSRPIEILSSLIRSLSNLENSKLDQRSHSKSALPSSPRYMELCKELLKLFLQVVISKHSQISQSSSPRDCSTLDTEANDRSSNHILLDRKPRYASTSKLDYECCRMSSPRHLEYNNCLLETLLQLLTQKHEKSSKNSYEDIFTNSTNDDISHNHLTHESNVQFSDMCEVRTFQNGFNREFDNLNLQIRSTDEKNQNARRSLVSATTNKQNKTSRVVKQKSASPFPSKASNSVEKRSVIKKQQTACDKTKKSAHKDQVNRCQSPNNIYLITPNAEVKLDSILFSSTSSTGKKVVQIKHENVSKPTDSIFQVKSCRNVKCQKGKFNFVDLLGEHNENIEEETNTSHKDIDNLDEMSAGNCMQCYENADTEFALFLKNKIDIIRNKLADKVPTKPVTSPPPADVTRTEIVQKFIEKVVKIVHQLTMEHFPFDRQCGQKYENDATGKIQEPKFDLHCGQKYEYDATGKIQEPKFDLHCGQKYENDATGKILEPKFDLQCGQKYENDPTGKIQEPKFDLQSGQKHENDATGKIQEPNKTTTVDANILDCLINKLDTLNQLIKEQQKLSVCCSLDRNVDVPNKDSCQKADFLINSQTDQLSTFNLKNDRKAGKKMAVIMQNLSSPPPLKGFDYVTTMPNRSLTKHMEILQFCKNNQVSGPTTNSSVLVSSISPKTELEKYAGSLNCTINDRQANQKCQQKDTVGDMKTNLDLCKNGTVNEAIDGNLFTLTSIQVNNKDNEAKLKSVDRTTKKAKKVQRCLKYYRNKNLPNDSKVNEGGILHQLDSEIGKCHNEQVFKLKKTLSNKLPRHTKCHLNNLIEGTVNSSTRISNIKKLNSSIDSKALKLSESTKNYLTDVQRSKSTLSIACGFTVKNSSYSQIPVSEDMSTRTIYTCRSPSSSVQFEQTDHSKCLLSLMDCQKLLATHIDVSSSSNSSHGIQARKTTNYKRCRSLIRDHQVPMLIDTEINTSSASRSFLRCEQFQKETDQSEGLLSHEDCHNVASRNPDVKPVSVIKSSFRCVQLQQESDISKYVLPHKVRCKSTTRDPEKKLRRTDKSYVQSAQFRQHTDIPEVLQPPINYHPVSQQHNWINQPVSQQHNWIISDSIDKDETLSAQTQLSDKPGSKVYAQLPEKSKGSHDGDKFMKPRRKVLAPVKTSATYKLIDKKQSPHVVMRNQGNDHTPTRRSMLRNHSIRYSQDKPDTGQNTMLSPASPKQDTIPKCNRRWHSADAYRAKRLMLDTQILSSKLAHQNSCKSDYKNKKKAIINNCRLKLSLDGNACNDESQMHNIKSAMDNYKRKNTRRKSVKSNYDSNTTEDETKSFYTFAGIEKPQDLVSSSDQLSDIQEIQLSNSELSLATQHLDVLINKLAIQQIEVAINQSSSIKTYQRINNLVKKHINTLLNQLDNKATHEEVNHLETNDSLKTTQNAVAENTYLKEETAKIESAELNEPAVKHGVQVETNVPQLSQMSEEADKSDNSDSLSATNRNSCTFGFQPSVSDCIGNRCSEDNSICSSSKDTHKQKFWTPTGDTNCQVYTFTGGEGSQICTSIGGVGSQICTSAGGEGSQICTSAGREGFQICTSTGVKGSQICTSTGRKGSQICTSAGGEGSQICTSIGGEGSQICTSIGGEGSQICTSKEGEGSQICISTGVEGSQICTTAEGADTKTYTVTEGEGSQICTNTEEDDLKICTFTGEEDSQNHALTGVEGCEICVSSGGEGTEIWGSKKMGNDHTYFSNRDENSWTVCKQREKQTEKLNQDELSYQLHTPFNYKCTSAGTNARIKQSDQDCAKNIKISFPHYMNQYEETTHKQYVPFDLSSKNRIPNLPNPVIHTSKVHQASMKTVKASLDHDSVGSFLPIQLSPLDLSINHTYKGGQLLRTFKPTADRSVHDTRFHNLYFTTANSPAKKSKQLTGSSPPNLSNSLLAFSPGFCYKNMNACYSAVPSDSSNNKISSFLESDTTNATKIKSVLSEISPPNKGLQKWIQANLCTLCADLHCKPDNIKSKKAYLFIVHPGDVISLENETEIQTPNKTLKLNETPEIENRMYTNGQALPHNKSNTPDIFDLQCASNAHVKNSSHDHDSYTSAEDNIQSPHSRQVSQNDESAVPPICLSCYPSETRSQLLLNSTNQKQAAYLQHNQCSDSESPHHKINRAQKAEEHLKSIVQTLKYMNSLVEDETENSNAESENVDSKDLARENEDTNLEHEPTEKVITTKNFQKNHLSNEHLPDALTSLCNICPNVSIVASEDSSPISSSSSSISVSPYTKNKATSSNLAGETNSLLSCDHVQAADTREPCVTLSCNLRSRASPMLSPPLRAVSSMDFQANSCTVKTSYYSQASSSNTLSGSSSFVDMSQLESNTGMARESQERQVSDASLIASISRMESYHSCTSSFGL